MKSEVRRLMFRTRSILVLVGILMLTSIGSLCAQGTPPVLGDLNGNGRIDVADASIALRISIGMYTPSPYEVALADIMPPNPDGTLGDGQVKLNDAIYLLRVAAGLESGLPVAQVGNIAGRVTDSSIAGATVPVAGATVAYTALDNPAPLGTAVTDSRGWYLLRNIQPGQYRLAAVADRYDPVDTVKPVAVAANTVIRIDLPLQPAVGGGTADLFTGVITGRVVDTSVPGVVQPVVGATVGYRTVENPEPIATTVTDSAGYYRFAKVKPDVYHVVVIAEKYNQMMTKKPITVSAQKAVKQDFVLERSHGEGGGSFLTATISARVVDKSIPGITLPIPNALVGYRRPEDIMPVATTTTDADGWFFFGNVAPGVYYLLVIADKYAQASTSQPLVVLPGNTWPATDDPARQLVLAKANGPGGGTFDTFSLTGRVVEQSLAGVVTPISGATVAYKDPTTQQVLGSTTTDAGGYFWFSKLTPGIYQISVIAPGYNQLTTSAQVFPPGITASIDIALQKSSGEGGGTFDTSTITGRVVDQVSVPGAVIPVEGATVGYRTPDNPVPIATATTNKDGWFFFGNVKPGQYMLAVIAEKYNQATTKSFTLGPGATYQTDLTLSPSYGSPGAGSFTTATLTGRVLDTSTPGNEVAVSGAVVSYRLPGDAKPIATTTTDASGWYRFPSVQPGVYRIDVTAEGYNPAVIQKVTVSVGTTVTQDVGLKK